MNASNTMNVSTMNAANTTKASNGLVEEPVQSLAGPYPHGQLATVLLCIRS